MLKRLLVLLGLLSGSFGYAKTVTSVAVSPQGAVLVVGTSMQYSALCTYSDSSTDDCTAAGGATWSTPTAALTLTSSGNVTWNSSYDPENKTLFPEGAQTAIGDVHVTAGGMSDTAQLLAQSSGATFIVWTTPDPGFYGDIQTGAYPPPTVAVGATVTIGAGFQWNQGGPANPFQMTCNWSSSDNTIATVNRYGMATAVAPGTVTITCGAAGNGQYETDVQYSGNTFTFNVIAPTPTNQTWYVRPNGGTPFINSTQTPNGQCDGLHDADYPGTGVDQPCAVGNFRYLWTDQVTPNHEQWMIGPGDTVIIRQNPNGYNLGLDQLAPAYGGSATLPINCGNPDCYMPTIPSGTASNHTKILGENYGSCTSDSAKTKLLVTWGAIYGINVKDSQYVDISCVEVTQVAACAYSAAFTNECQGNSNYGRNGVVESALTSNVTYTDMLVHGLALEAIRGATGAGVVANRVHIRGTPFGGFDMDDVPHSLSNMSVAGGITMTNSLTEFVGCIEEKPIVHNYPYIECRDQNTGGYGDGFGTGSTTGNWTFDHDIWRYNFQDGLDLLHSGLQSLSVTNSQSYGNDGNQFKLGSAQNVTFQNNFAVSNCQRIAYLFGDEPASAIVPGVNLCRADGGDVIISFYAYGNYLLQYNTMVGYGDVLLGYHCDFGSDNCSTANTTMQNNSLMGYADTNNGYNGGENAAMICAATATDCDNALSNFPANQGWATRNNNQYDGTRKCPISLTANETCNTQDPLFVGEPSNPITDETVFDNFTGHLTSSSPLIGAGVAIPNLLVDQTGALRPNPPSIGAFEYAAASALATPQVALAATPNPATVGQSVTLTATVAEIGSTMPTGSVTFSYNGTSLGSATLSSSGVATLSTSSLPTGSDALTVTYTGDSTYAPGASNSYTLTVNPAAKTSTATTISSSLNPATTSQAITLTATVSSTSGSSSSAPTGTVTFLDGSTSLGSATLGNSGTAALQLTSMTAGTHTITSQYSGDSNFSTSTSTALTETVNSPSAATTTTSLVPSPNPATTGQAVTLTATVATNSGTPTGTVAFFDGGTSLGNGTISSGVAAIQVTSFAAGNHTLTAQYAGNSNFAASTSSAVAESVNSSAATQTATLLQTSASQVVAGQAITLTATVSATSGKPTGTVTFLAGSSSLGSATLSGSGAASIQISSLAVGTYSLSAQYAGNSSFASSASSTISETVSAASLPATTSTLTISPNPTPTGQSATMTVAVTSSSGTPTGTVSFLNNGTAIGSATLNSSGVATFTPSSLPAAGTYAITVQYAGTSAFSPSTSNAIQWQVETSGVTLSLNTSNLKVPNGVSTSNTVTLTLTPFGGYSGTLQMGCPSAPAGTTCTFTPQSVSVSQNGGPTNVNVTVKTSPVASLEPRNLRPFEAGKALVFSASFLWIPGLLTAAFVGLRRKQLMPRSGRVLLLLVLACMFGALTGCGSGAADPSATPTTMPLQLVVSGSGIANQSITLTITSTNN